MPIPRVERKEPSADHAVRGLLIVARDCPHLFHALEQQFGGTRQVAVVLDRRREERRRGMRPVTTDLRRSDRRSLPDLHDDLDLRKYVLVRPHYRRPLE